MLGWVMTCSYVGSRIPQLIKNYRRGMTTGLSLPMFVLLVLGSTTYVASIFVRSVHGRSQQVQFAPTQYICCCAWQLEMAVECVLTSYGIMHVAGIFVRSVHDVFWQASLPWASGICC